jgi:hypothetical protein
VRALFADLPVRDLKVRSAVYLPTATRWACAVERVAPAALPWGGLIVVAGEKA